MTANRTALAIGLLTACNVDPSRDPKKDGGGTVTPPAPSTTSTTATTTPTTAGEPWSRDEIASPGSVTFTEIAYHAAGDDELEWIELHNPRAVATDLTGWSLTGGVSFAFPDGTLLPAGGYLVVASDPAMVAGALGPLVGRLDADGERVELVTNGGRRVDSVHYGSDDPWPVAADGSGHTLAKIRADAPSDHAEGWAASREAGGTPGRANGVDPAAAPASVPLIAAGATWAWDTSGSYPAPDWADPAYDDALWALGVADFWISGGTVQATLRMTADNDCAAWVGPADASTLWFVGEDVPGDWTTPKTFAVDVAPDDHLFIAAWESAADNGGPQMLIAEVELPSGILGTGVATFEQVLGPLGNAPGITAADPPPADATVTAVVADADATGRWAPPAATLPPASAPWGGALAPSFDPSTWYVWPDTFADDSVTNQRATWALFRSVDPVAGAEALWDVPTTTTFRGSFDFVGDPGRTTLALACRIDDGAVLWLNGVEILRSNLPAGPIAADTLALAPAADPNLFVDLPGDALVPGANVLAVEVHQATTDPTEDLWFGCELTATDDPADATLGVVLNEIGAAGDAPFLVELAGALPAGLVLASSNGDEWPAPTADLGFVELDAAFEAGDVLYLYDASGTLLDAVRVWDQPRAREAIRGPWRVPTAPTPGAENAIDIEDDIVVNEIAYHRAPVSEDGLLFEERPDEWIELHNRGTDAVDVSGWQLADAVTFTFPEGTTLAAGGFLVVAGDAAAVSLEHPEADVVGDFDGKLGNASDRIVVRDARGNPVDEVRWYDGGRWPAPADGGGSTLELRDPRADNSVPEAWAASVEGGGAQWTDVTIEDVALSSAVGPDGQWEEFVLGLLDDGEVLIDDISVVRDPAGAAFELIRDGSFDEPEPWRLLGTHSHSEIVPDPDDAGNPVLRVVATGATEHMHNHVETTLRSIVTDVPHRISFRARWVSGSNLLHTRLYFSRLPHLTRVPRPATWGTPGQPNATRADLGPTFADLRQHVLVPAPGEAVPISVVAADPDGVTGVTLWTSSGGAFAGAAMVQGDDGAWTGTIAGRGAGEIVQFYVEATDGAALTSTLPAAGPDSRALIRWDAGPGATTGVHDLRLILTEADSDWLHDEPNLMSNDPIGGTVVIDGERVVYDVGVRAKGSERGRPEVARLGYALSFPPHDPFRGSHASVLLDRSEGVVYGQREFLLNLVAADLGLPFAEYNDLAYATTPRPEHTGAVELQLDRNTDLVLEAQYPDGGDGSLHDYELIYYPLTTDDGTPVGQKLPQPDAVVGAALTNMGPDPEAYRWTFPLQSQRDADDYGPLVDLCQTFGSSDAVFLADAPTVIDVDQWLGGFAFASLAAAVDNYGGDGAQHNARFWLRPDDGLFLYFPHDLDFFGSSSMSVIGNNDLQRLLADRTWHRSYYEQLYDTAARGFDPVRLDRICGEVGALLPDQDFAGHCATMKARAAWVLSGSGDAVVRAYPRVDFAVTTNGGADFTTASPDVVLQGDGWIDVHEVWWSGSPLALTWVDADTWQVTVPLAIGVNAIDLTATDLAGDEVGADTIAVSYVP